jgi:Ca-activated chloride channel family protein
MEEPDKLPLAKQALKILTEHLTDTDSVSLVTYAGATRVVLEPTGAGMLGKAKIMAAIDDLRSSGSTAMASGIDLAYARAAKGLVPGHISRVIVLSDGDANVGAHTHDEILKIIAGRAKEGVTLSTIGFGTGNYRDELMEQLADKGNGNNYYIDSKDQAKRVFQTQLVQMLEVVAKDVKLQVDFDPAMVARYRLVGYENRDIKDEDFRKDQVDAGEIGAGHQVTALYEIVPVVAGRGADANPFVGDRPAPPPGPGMALRVRLRYQPPGGGESRLIESDVRAIAHPGPARGETAWAAAVAGFGMVLRGSPDRGTCGWCLVRELAGQAGDTRDPQRREFLELVEAAESRAR